MGCCAVVSTASSMYSTQSSQGLHHLFGRGIGEILWINIIFEELVMCRDDVFNFRAVFGFLQPQCVDQNALVPNRRCYSLEFSKAPATGRQLFETGGGVKMGGV